MEKVLTIEVNLNLKADESLVGLVGAIAAITGGKQVCYANGQPAPTDAEMHTDDDDHKEPALEKPKKTRGKKADPEPTPQPDPEPTPVPQPKPEPAQAPAPQVSLEEVKQVFFQKLAGHRDEIRTKINELGAPSLSTIEPSKLPEMLEFLKGLD